MRTRASVAAVLVAAAVTAGAADAAGGPGAVYSDYVQDGKLSCNHSRAALLAALNSSTLNQYGDPYALSGMKLAVRQQLARGCARSGGTPSGATRSGAGNGANGSTPTPTPGATNSTHPRRHQRPKAPGTRSPEHRTAAAKQGSVGGGNDMFLAGRGVVLLVLVAALAVGGWLTKQALAARD